MTETALPGLIDNPSDAEMHLMKPFIDLFLDGGLRYAKGPSDWLTADPVDAARMAGMSFSIRSLAEIETVEDASGFFEHLLELDADAFILTEIDVPVLGAGPEKEDMRQMRDVVAAGLHALFLKSPRFVLLAGLTDLGEALAQGAAASVPVVSVPRDKAEDLFTLSHETLGTVYGEALAKAAEERSMVPDLVMLNLDRHAGLGVRYVRPLVEGWLGTDKANAGPLLPKAFLHPGILENLIDADVLDLKNMALFQKLPDEPEHRRYYELLGELLESLGFWTPVVAEENDRPDEKSLPAYDYASAFGVKALAVMELSFVMSPDADWATPARELVRAMWEGEPNAALESLGNVLECIEDQEADIDIAGLSAACLLALDLDLTREVKADEGLDIINVRLPGGPSELVFAPEVVDPETLGNPDGTPRMVLTIM